MGVVGRAERRLMMEQDSVGRCQELGAVCYRIDPNNTTEASNSLQPVLLTEWGELKDLSGHCPEGMSRMSGMNHGSLDP